MTISRSPLRFTGGKAMLAQQIIDLMPAHRIYCEPFAGGARVLLRKPRAEREIYNDLDGNITNFFQQLRDNTRRLIRAIQWTPFSRTELKRAWQYAGDDPLQRALATYIKSWQSWGSGTGHHQSGWRFQATGRRAGIRDWNKVSHPWEIAARLKSVQIENHDALKILTRYDSARTFFYCDPPYLPSTWRKDGLRKAYQHVMTDEQHVELAAILRGLEGMVMLSGYQSPLYDQLYVGWHCFKFEHYTINRERKTIECLWLSPNCIQTMSEEPLFSVTSLPIFSTLKEA